MFNKTNETPFNELPESLVVDMLNQCDEIGEKLTNSFQKLYEIRKDIRQHLKERNLLKKDTDIMLPPTYPTSCAIDGSFSIEKLLSTDIVAAASVAVEGLAPPTEVRHWPKPRHYSKILTIPHSNATEIIIRAIMMCMELSIAVKAPHNVVFLDGSFITPLIKIYQAINSLNETPEDLRKEFEKRFKIALGAYIKVLLSKKSDQIYTSVPKYTTIQELTNKVLNLKEYEDRGLLSFILKPGELVGPINVYNWANKFHIVNPPLNSGSFINHIIESLDDIQIIYYRPFDHVPSLRLEFSPLIANNKNRLSILLEAVKQQCSVPGIMEPFPLYLADRMVKHLRTALPAIRKTTTQEMSLKWMGKYSDLFFAMHGYRTEWGK